MSDLIERKAAIDALDKEYRCTDQTDDWDGLKTAMLIVENLPSAQADSKELSFTHKALDTISRQDAIRIVDGIDTWQAGWRGDAIESMKALPTAQPETHEERTETHACDLTNSQQAINLLKGLEQSLDDYCELNDEGKAAFRMAITALELFGNSEQLPSAQPERKKGKWIEQEDWWEDVYYECSACGEPWTMIDGTPWDNGMNFCPNCGARMEDER